MPDWLIWESFLFDQYMCEVDPTGCAGMYIWVYYMAPVVTIAVILWVAFLIVYFAWGRMKRVDVPRETSPDPVQIPSEEELLHRIFPDHFKED